ncbi:MAG: PQQ-binding-like beta-propeller repeat protein, partial [candidate division WOR-3 bacterium]|nr:PQQ-binding-like beta-propeller repeat protein [candidate division WOR-3 bacterium]
TPHVDFTGDGIPEVLVASGGNGLDNRIYCLNGATGGVLWSYLTGGSVEYVISIDDVNGNGIPDVVGGGWAYILYCVEGSNGSLIWQNNFGSARVIYELRKIRDLNGDGKNDIVVGSWSSLVSVVSGATGSILWSTDVGSDCWNVDTMPDITGDGKQEVVAGALNGRKVSVLSGANGSIIWQYSFADRVYDVACGSDLNGDGIADVLVGLQDQQSQPYHLYAFSGLPLGIEEVSLRPIIKDFRVVNSKSHITLTIKLPENMHLQAELYDLTGRVVESFKLILCDNGVAKVNIMKSNKSPGIYFLGLKINHSYYTIKLPLF